jgi:hypothetical protein
MALARLVPIGRFAGALGAIVNVFVAEAVGELGAVAIEAAPVLVVDDEVAVVSDMGVESVAGDFEDVVGIVRVSGEVADPDLAGIGLRGPLRLHPPLAAALLLALAAPLAALGLGVRHIKQAAAQSYDHTTEQASQCLAQQATT